MLLVRLAMPEDEDAVIEMARENMETTRAEIGFDEAKCRRTYHSYLTTASPSIWVVEHKREAIAFLLAEIYEYRAASGLYTTQEVLYVKPAHRGTRAAILLMKHLVAWSEVLGAKEIIGGVDNSFNIDRTAKFLEHFGFERVGHAMRRSLSDGR